MMVGCGRDEHTVKVGIVTPEEVADSTTDETEETASEAALPASSRISA